MSLEKGAAWLLAIQHLENQDKINDYQRKLIANQDELNSNLSGIAEEIRRQLDVLQESLVRKSARCGNILKDGSSFCHVCGMKRHQCSCGEFLDAGMVFCAKCGKKIEFSEEEILYFERLRFILLLETIKEQKVCEEEKEREKQIAAYKKELKSQDRKENIWCAAVAILMIAAVVIWFLAH